MRVEFVNLLGCQCRCVSRLGVGISCLADKLYYRVLLLFELLVLRYERHVLLVAGKLLYSGLLRKGRGHGSNGKDAGCEHKGYVVNLLSHFILIGYLHERMKNN